MSSFLQQIFRPTKHHPLWIRKEQTYWGKDTHTEMKNPLETCKKVCTPRAQRTASVTQMWAALNWTQNNFRSLIQQGVHMATQAQPSLRCVSQSASKPSESILNVSMEGHFHQIVTSCLSSLKLESMLRTKALKLDDPGFLVSFFKLADNVCTVKGIEIEHPMPWGLAIITAVRQPL